MDADSADSDDLYEESDDDDENDTDSDSDSDIEDSEVVKILKSNNKKTFFLTRLLWWAVQFVGEVNKYILLSLNPLFNPVISILDFRYMMRQIQIITG